MAKGAEPVPLLTNLLARKFEEDEEGALRIVVECLRTPPASDWAQESTFRGAQATGTNEAKSAHLQTVIWARKLVGVQLPSETSMIKGRGRILVHPKDSKSLANQTRKKTGSRAWRSRSE